MSALPQNTRRKLSLLELPDQFGNVSALDEQTRCPAQPSAESLGAGEVTLDYALRFPTYGQQRVANELRLQNAQISPAGVRAVWLRHDLETRHKRLLRLERHAQKQTFVLSEKQVALLERHSSDLRCRHLEATRPGELLNQDTFYWGTLKALGKV